MTLLGAPTRVALALLAAGLACQTPAPLPSTVLVTDGRYAMGTLLEITVAEPPAGFGRAALAPLFDEVARLEAIFSRHQPTSDVSRLNLHAGRGPLAASPELGAILADARLYSESTRGTFDVTVGPLVALWVQAARANRLPAANALAAARARVGAGKLRLHADGRVELAEPGMAVDLGGIAKGWALDRVAERLRAAGRGRALLDFGRSSLVALGAPPGAPGWRILLEDAGDGFAGTLTLRDRALSVSGSLGQWSTIAGRRYGHVIDPRTGEPMQRAYLAVVLAPSAAAAEAWSKALLILGPEEGLALLEAERGLEGLLLDEAGARFATRGFVAAAGFVAQ